MPSAGRTLRGRMSASPRIGAYLGLALVPLLAFAVGWGIGRLPGGMPSRAAHAPAGPATGMRPGGAAPAPAPPDDPGGARRPTLSEWTTYRRALDEAHASGKPILLDFNAAWCGPCRRLKQEVFEDPFRGEAVRAAVIPVSLQDRVREDGANPPELATLQRQYGIEALPTLIVFSARTGESERLEGFGDPASALAWIQWAAARVR
jgi:thiol:disulfide interchange protein